MTSKEIMAKNLRYYIEKSGKDRRTLAEIWGIPYSTLTEWMNARKYPRIDRIEIMADYFGIQKSDLIEESNMTNKEVFAENLQKYMQSSGKSQKELAEIVGVSAPTFNEWVGGKKYPRIDKIQRMADYFGIQKSDLIEDNPEAEQKAGDDVLANIVARLRTDADYRQLAETLYTLNAEKLKSMQQMLQTFAK